MCIDQEKLKKAITILGVASPDGAEDCAARQDYFVDRLAQAVIDSAKTFQAMIWQPIESALKDGSDLWLLDFDKDFEGVGYFSVDKSAWFDLDGDALNPTYWMHKPLPPMK